MKKRNDFEDERFIIQWSDQFTIRVYDKEDENYFAIMCNPAFVDMTEEMILQYVYMKVGE